MRHYYNEDDAAAGVDPRYFRFDVAWINTKLAKHGTQIKFRDLAGIYEVWEVWGTLPKDEVELRERTFKNQRETSDVDRNPKRGKVSDG